jgi:hypothetical protein
MLIAIYPYLAHTKDARNDYITQYGLVYIHLARDCKSSYSSFESYTVKSAIK